jgi:hypothetical protein
VLSSLFRLSYAASSVPMLAHARQRTPLLPTLPHFMFPPTSRTAFPPPPPQFGSLRQLVSLDLSRNRLRALPPSMGSLLCLETLDASCNCLKTLPRTMGLLVNLLSLSLAQNEIMTLPDSLGGMSSLQALKLHGNVRDGRHGAGGTLRVFAVNWGTVLMAVSAHTHPADPREGMGGGGAPHTLTAVPCPCA